MTEHEIFFAAIEIGDAQQRAEYLARACEDQPDLRGRVEILLAAHDQSGEFMQVPALRQVATPAENQEPGIETSQLPAVRPDSDLSFLAPSQQSGSLGRLMHYEIREVIGRGGCGIVLRAFDEKLERIVAIKVMAPELAATSPARKRFLREARATAAVRHENVVSVHAVEEQPLPFLVMEFIDGETLQERIDRTGPLDVQEVLRIGQRIAQGLVAAHAKGLIHRDIKPGNILLENGTDRLKITDFGLARSADDASLTQSGVIAGTPLYMSPEQAMGRDIDQRSDLFSLGSVLYVMCSGRPPFRAATSIAVLRRVVEEQPRPIQSIIPEVPAWLSAIIARLHAKEPSERFASAQEVAELLGRCRSELEQHGRVESLDDLLPMVPQPADASSPQPASASSPQPSSALSPLAPVLGGEGPGVRGSGRSGIRPARSSSRKWMAAAATILVLLTGLGLSEATGVTNVRGTVIRLFSPEGTLVLEVDDPGVSVSLDGQEIVITGAGVKEIRLEPGQYKLLASKDGQLVSQELVTVTRNGRRVVRVSKEVEPAVAPPSGGLTAQQRDALEWVLSVGGQLNLSVNGAGALLNRGDALPSTEFVVGNLSLKGVKDIAGLVEKLSAVPPVQHTILLTNTGVGDKEVAALAALPAFHRTAYWDLGGTQVTDAALKALSQLPNLHGGTFDRTAITDVGVKYLAASDNLMHLSLSETAVTDAGLEYLAAPKWWNSLAVKKTKVTEAGVKKLAKAIPHLRIYWDGGVIQPTQPSDPDRRAAEALHHYATLRLRLDSGRAVDVKAADSLPDADFVVTDIVVTFSGELPEQWTRDVLLPSVMELSSLKTIFARYRNDIPCTDADLLRLAEMPSRKTLHTFCIRPLYLTSTAIDVLKQFPALKDVVFTAPEPDDKLLARLAELPAVEFLHIEHLDQKGRVGAAGKAALAALPLSRLAVNGTTIDADFARSVAGMSTLKVLNAGNNQYKSGAVAELAKSKSLTDLAMGYSNVSDADLVPLPGLKSLQALNIMATKVTDAGLKNLVACSALKFVELSHAKVTEAGVRQLAKAVPHLRIYWDGGVIEPTQPSDPDRRAAEALHPYASLNLRLASGRTVFVPLAEELPSEPFVVTRISFAFEGELPARWTEEVLVPVVTPLRSLTQLFGRNRNVPCTDADLLRLVRMSSRESLTSFCLRTPLTPTAINVLKELPRLDTVDFVADDVDDALLARLAELPAVRDLALHELDRKGWVKGAYKARVSDKGYAAIAALPVRKLGFNTLPLDAAFARRLAGMPALQRLGVGGTQYLDGSVAELAKSKTLTSLVMGHSNISDADLELLLDLKTLQELQVIRTKVTEAGVKKLAAARPDLRIHWDGGVIEPTQPSDPNRRAAEWVLSIGGTVRVDERDQDITAVTGLPKDDFRLTLIDLDDIQQVSDAELARLKDCKDLVNLNLARTRISNAGLAHFKDCTKLESLNLDDTQVGDAGLAHFKDCKHLTTLILTGSRVSDTGLAYFKDCQNLEILGLFGTPVTDVSLGQLKDSKNLKLVNLGRTRVSAEGVKKLAPALPQCRIKWDGGVIEPTKLSDPDRRAAEWVLSVGGFVKVKVAGKEQRVEKAVDLPAEAFQLSYVHLMNNRRVGDDGLANLKGCQGIGYLDVRGTLVTDAGLAHLKDCTSIEDLRLSNNLITDAGVAHFKNCKRLACLQLGVTQITDAGLASFQDCKYLVSLELSKTAVTDAGLAHFKDCRLLEVLGLYEAAGVTDAGMAHFQDCRNLKSLTLALTSIGDAGLAHFGDCPGLTALDLRDTRLTDAGLATMRRFGKLARLDVRGVKGATADGVAAVHKALPQCRIEWDGGVIEPTKSAATAKAAAAAAPSDILASPDYEWSAPVNLGATINSAKQDGQPSISADQLCLMFVSNRSGDFRLHEARRKRTSEPWAEPVQAPGFTDRIYSPFLDSNGLTLLFCRNGKHGHDDIWTTRRADRGKPWEEPVNLGPTVNSSGSDQCPALSLNGLTLYFSSTRAGGAGGFDLWMCHRETVDSAFEKPVNLGPAINSADADGDPCPSADGRHLIFVRTTGNGSQLHIATRGEDGNWTTQPIELSSDLDIRQPALSLGGSTLYFETDRLNGQGESDLWFSFRRLKKPAAVNAASDTATPSRQ